jgi:hypothetical protein
MPPMMIRDATDLPGPAQRARSPSAPALAAGLALAAGPGARGRPWRSRPALALAAGPGARGRPWRSRSALALAAGPGARGRPWRSRPALARSRPAWRSRPALALAAGPGARESPTRLAARLPPSRPCPVRRWTPLPGAARGPHSRRSPPADRVRSETRLRRSSSRSPRPVRDPSRRRDRRGTARSIAGRTLQGQRTCRSTSRVARDGPISVNLVRAS